MRANEEKQPEAKPTDVATLFQELLAKAVSTEDERQRADMLVQVAQLSQQATERAKVELARRTQVEVDEKGRLVSHSLEGLRQIGKFYAEGGKLIPDAFRDKPGDCAIAYQMADRLGLDPLSFMQKSFVVHGKPGVETTLLLGLLHSSGKIKGRVRYDIERNAAGEIVACSAWAIDAATGEKIVGPRVTWEMAEKEGWTRDKKERDSDRMIPSKWKSLRELMFPYRAASYLIRRDYSDVSLGIMTREELEDIEPTVYRDEGQHDWVRPATGSVLGNGTVVAPTPEPEPLKTTPKPEPPKSVPAAQETVQPEYVNDVSEAARRETVEHTVPPTVAPEPTGHDKLDGYLTAISMAPAGGVDQIIQRAMDDKELNDAQFDVIKTAGEKRKLNLQQSAAKPSNGDGAKFVAQIKTMKSQTGVKSVVQKAEAAGLPQGDLDAVYAAATAQNQVVNGGRPLLKSA